ncbi:hypothetical protein HMSSN036_93870 [Paenibacillus macerans]|nr:hypothetical protein HMSSN036_93870 [Paenibacillus macerans]
MIYANGCERAYLVKSRGTVVTELIYKKKARNRREKAKLSFSKPLEHWRCINACTKSLVHLARNSI